jgi:hypothetical protein
MLKELKMLLSLRAWWRSTSLKAGGVAGILGALQVYLSTSDGTDLVALVAGFLHVMPATLGGVIMAIVGLAIWILRAKSEWSLSEKAAGVDQLPQNQTGSNQHGYIQLTLIYVLLVVGTLFFLELVAS